MRIGVDYTSAVRQGGGIGRYTRNLIRAVAELDSTTEYVLFVAGGWGDGDGLGPWPPNFRVRSIPLTDRWMHFFWQRLRLPVPVQSITGPLELFHSPDFVLPPTGRAPAILTVHDLSFLRVPHFFVNGFREYLETAVSRAVSRAVHILVDSESTCRDLAELMAVDDRRMTVVYPGVEKRFGPVRDLESLESVRARYALPRRFIMGLSTLQPRKNFSGLIRAFAKLLEVDAGAIGRDDLSLVIIGAKGWMYEDTLSLVRHLGLEDRVRFLGFAADDDLPALYTLASVFAFPSWYEGFGLPILEAMACGTPVVAADNSSLPEVIGTAGLMVESADTGGLANAMDRLLKDGELRARMVAAGMEQARRFTWKAAASQVIEVYETFAARARIGTRIDDPPPHTDSPHSSGGVRNENPVDGSDR